MSKADETGQPAPSRRGFLRAATAGTAATALGVGATGTTAAQDGGDFDGWMSDVGNYDGTVADRTGQDSVTVTVGAQGNGGGFAFGPPAIRVDPGTTVVFEWNGEGGQHNVVAEEGADFESELTAEAGFTFEHTFESEGTVKYFCQPHRALGMKGVVVVGGSGGGGGGSQATPVPAEYGDWFSNVDNYDGSTVDERGNDSVTVSVGAQGNGGGFAFDPPAVRVSPGTTITFEWTGDGGQHNVVAEDGADFESELTSEAGFTFEHTFEDPGVVTYFCSPHRSLGMKGAVVVDPSSPGAGGEGGGEEEEGGQLVLTPGLTALGGAIVLGILSPIIFAVLLAFRRGSLGSSPEAAGGATGERLERVEPQAAAEEFVTTDAPLTEPETEIGHDEFDPTGTAGMIIIYFLILVLLWIFMYFVEFIGGGPTIIG